MDIDLSDISQTALLMVAAHANDATATSPILNDQSAIEVLKYLNNQNIQGHSKLLKILRKKNFHPLLTTYIVSRAKYYDTCCRNFLKNNPTGTIINMGCGLDQRFERIDNGQLQFLDIDLPKVISIKEHFSIQTKRYKQIPCSIFDFKWMDLIESHKVLFLAEGVFMYCNHQDIKKLFLTLVEKFPQSEIICELSQSLYATKLYQLLSRPSLKFNFGIGSEAAFKFGVTHSKQLANWSPHIKWEKDWSVLDEAESRNPIYSLLKKIPFAKRQIWTAHYRFN